MAKKSRRKNPKAKDEPIFNKGDLVGGRVKGYPLWPGVIEAINNTGNKPRYTIRFFQSEDCSDKCISIKHFRDFTNTDKRCNRAGFKEALRLCEIEFAKREKEAPKVVQVKVEPKEDQSNKLVDSGENDNTLKVTPEVRTQQGEPLTLNTEGENVILNPTRDEIIAKLEVKVAKKIQEKQARKEEVKAAKISGKIIKALKVVNKHLEKFSLASNRVSNNDGQTNPSEWMSAVVRYERVFPALEKCIKHSDKQLCNYEEIGCEYRKSQEIITAIITSLKTCRKSNQLPEDIAKKLKECLRVTKERNKAIDDLLNSSKFGNSKNAMIERRINDAE